MKNSVSEIWDILCDVEDLQHGEYRRGRDQAPTPKRSRRDTGSAEARPLDSVTSIDALGDLIRRCKACQLGSLRKNAVPGEGAANPLVMVIGEGPGGGEDETGRPFVGRAGQYLDKWLAAIGLSRENEVFIGNVIKCRPPNNRDPEAEEMEACLPYLLKQIELLQPKSILCLGRFAGRKISGDEQASLSRMRGSLHSFKNIPVVVTYHPSAVLRNAELRRPVWEDLQLLKNLLADLG